MEIILIDTDSCLLFFIFICKIECSVTEKEGRNLIFESFIESKVFRRLDLFDIFWEKTRVSYP